MIAKIKLKYDIPNTVRYKTENINEMRPDVVEEEQSLDKIVAYDVFDNFSVLDGNIL